MQNFFHMVILLEFLEQLSPHITTMVHLMGAKNHGQICLIWGQSEPRRERSANREKSGKEKRPEVALHTIILGLLLSWSENLWLTRLLLSHPTVSSNDLITEHTGQCLAVTSRRKFKVLYYNSVLLTIFVFWKLVLQYPCCFCLRKVSFLSHRHFQSVDKFSHQLAWKNPWWVFMVEPGSMFTVYGSW